MVSTVILGEIFTQTSTEEEIMSIVQRGLPPSAVEALKQTGLTFDELDSVVMPSRTLKHRREKHQPLAADETDRVMRVAAVIELADKVFTDHQKAMRWLRRENQSFGGRVPLDLLKTEYGGDLVRQKLYQIDEGIFD
jgi:putative toxin-antitoxin system antitoxin component (TIGR02293 family)